MKYKEYNLIDIICYLREYIEPGRVRDYLARFPEAVKSEVIRNLNLINLVDSPEMLPVSHLEIEFYDRFQESSIN